MQTPIKTLAAGVALAAVAAYGSAVQAAVVFFQGFETDTAGVSTPAGYGSIARLASGTGGVPSSDGGFHANVQQSTFSPYTFFGGSSSVFPGTYVAQVDVYLDTGWASGEGFDYSVASYGSDGAHRRDFIFHFAQDISSGALLVGGSNNTNFDPRQDLDTLANFYAVQSTGWYTLQHVFRDDGGVLAVDLNLLDENGQVLFTETRSDPTDTIPAIVGGNGYGWFTNIDVAGGIEIDNLSLEVVETPEPAALGLLGLGLAALALRRRRR